MGRERWLLGILTLLLAALIFLPLPSLLEFKKFLGSGGEEVINNPILENVALKSELAKLEEIKRQLGEWSPKYLSASVYSRYPFNLKNEFLVNAGLDQGLKGGEAVLIGKLLVGQVDKVFENTALVRTVFDERWKEAVRIGGEGIDALLEGGNTPKATLIVKDAKISEGDIVYNASPEFPYSLPIAEVKEIGISKDQIFKEAVLEFGYDLGRISAVLILKNYAPPPQE
ncbi:MAG: rod shape-determining protein MreC [Candidatus Liptonbacteria bacterium]|nr:rod shape-determining protein MreC [Candidatus Liptonbacteria bacterium]